MTLIGNASGRVGRGAEGATELWPRLFAGSTDPKELIVGRLSTCLKGLAPDPPTCSPLPQNRGPV
jgi:hypothetical protein